MWRRLLTVPAWAAVVLVLGPSGGPVPAGAPVATVEETAARLDALTVAITGSVEELRASEALNYHRVEGGVAACMAAAGRPYRMAPFVSFYEGFTDADLGYGTGSGTVIDSVTERGRRLVRNTISAARLARAGQGTTGTAPGDVEALNRCRAPYDHRAYHDVDPPPGAYELAAFPDLLETVYRDPRVAAAYRGYRPCMRARLGYDVAERTDFLFRTRLPAEHAPLDDGQPAHPEWTRGLRAVEEAFALDAECRLPAYREAMRVVAAALDAWERRHRAQLDAIRAEWRKRALTR